MPNAAPFITARQRKRIVDRLRARGMMISYGSSLKCLVMAVAGQMAVAVPKSQARQGDMLVRFLEGLGQNPDIEFHPLKPPSRAMVQAMARAHELFLIPGWGERITATNV